MQSDPSSEQPITGENCYFLLNTDGKERRICAKIWGPPGGKPLMAVHGWLDNAASFDPIAPTLVRAGYRVVALDLSGHGKSEHPVGEAFQVWLGEIIDVVDLLDWETFDLMGHSMGGALSVVLSGSIPSRVQRLILLDTMGPFGADPAMIPLRIEGWLGRRGKLLNRKPRVYASVDECVKRLLSNNPYIDPKSARLIVTRGTERIITATGEDGVRFRHDPTLSGKRVESYTVETALEFVKRISAPTLIIVADGKRNFMFPDGMMEKRVKYFQDLTVVTLPGGHHVHMDSPELVLPPILEHLSKPWQKPASKL